MSIRSLRMFLAVADRGGFAAAADAIGVTPSAISLQMKALEEETGGPLFDRVGRSLKLNARGERLAEQARKLVAGYDRLFLDLSITDELSGRIRLGCVHTLTTGALPPALHRLKKRHPGVEVSLHTGLTAELVAALKEGVFDAVAGTAAPGGPPEGCRSREISAEPYLVIAPYDAEGRTDAELLTELPFLRFAPTTWAGQAIETELRRRGIAVRDAMELDSLDAIWVMVGHGLGVSIVPRHPMMRLPGLSPIRLIPFGDPPLLRRLALYWRPEAATAPLIAALSAALQDE